MILDVKNVRKTKLTTSGLNKWGFVTPNLDKKQKMISVSNLPFSEIYFSEVKSKTVKAWKFHSQQTQNVSVAIGEIRIICVRKSSHETIFELFELNSEALHGVLTIPHGIYYALINVSEEPTILLNVTDLSHDSAENLSLPLEYPEFITLINEFGH